MIELLGHVIGVGGMTCVVFAYLCIERGWMSNTDIRLYLTNLVGAILLTISLIINFNLGSFIIELFWMGISLSGIWKWYKTKLEKKI